MAAIILIVCAVVSAVIAVVAVVYSRRDKSTDKQDLAAAEQIAAAINTALSPLRERLILVEDYPSKSLLTTKGLLMDHLDPIKERLTTVDVRLAAFEGFVKTLSVNMANTLHRPDPDRGPVDRLLEAFQHGTLVESEWNELRKHLITISRWEPGKASEYSIHVGEPGQAATLLAIMDSGLLPGPKQDRQS